MIDPGRYQGHGEPFTLQREGEGWRRVFDPARWTWDEARLWSDDEVAAKVRAGVWRRVTGKARAT